MSFKMNTFNVDVDSIVSKPSDVTATGQWYRLKLTPTGVTIAGLGEPTDGVSRYDLVAGSAASMITEGDIPMIAAGAIPAGAEICGGANGKVINVADAASGATIIGKLTNGTFAVADLDEVVATFYQRAQRLKP